MVDLYDTYLQCVNIVKHLGMHIDSNLTEKSEVIKKKGGDVV